jgi:PKD repeat protein
MKKKLLFTLLIFLFFHLLLSAQKYDYNWITGYGGNEPTSVEQEFGLTRINFSDEKVNMQYVNTGIWLDKTNTTMSDKDGKLLFYTNGGILNNKDNKVLKNSEKFNSSKFHDGYVATGLPIAQAILALPHPNKDYLYYLIYCRLEYKKKVLNMGLNYALIDMKGDNGNGEMIVKNEALLQDTLLPGDITTTKHANGRDWWIIQFEEESNRYYRILLSPAGFTVFPSQTVGDTLRTALSQACFSPDGSKYARCSGKYFYDPAQIDLYDFDRCSGLLSNHKRLKYNFGQDNIPGVCFSYDSKYMYTSPRTKVIQWDLKAKDIGTSGDTIGIYDGYKEEDKYAATFYLSQIAPDGKIYINATNGIKYFHVIHKPRQKGKDCQFQQRGLRLKSWNGFTIPNHPNYRLGPLDGSPCDTLGIDNIPVALFRYDQDTLNTAFVEFTDLSHHEPANWEWDFGDGTPKSKLQEPNHLFSKKGEYNVCLTVSNKYGKHTACKKVVINATTATNEPDFDKNISIYPNPISDILNIENLDNQIITVTDVLGKTMLTEKIIAGKNSINISHFPNGTYILKIGNATCKIIKI